MDQRLRQHSRLVLRTPMDQHMQHGHQHSRLVPDQHMQHGHQQSRRLVPRTRRLVLLVALEEAHHTFGLQLGCLKLFAMCRR